MATHYKGERISDLLNRIAELEQVLRDAPPEIVEGEMVVHFSQGYADLAIAKAKLTSLRGDDA
jgi:hypothetical protein